MLNISFTTFGGSTFKWYLCISKKRTTMKYKAQAEIATNKKFAQALFDTYRGINQPLNNDKTLFASATKVKENLSDYSVYFNVFYNGQNDTAFLKELIKNSHIGDAAGTDRFYVTVTTPTPDEATIKDIIDAAISKYVYENDSLPDETFPFKKTKVELLAIEINFEGEVHIPEYGYDVSNLYLYKNYDISDKAIFDSICTSLPAFNDDEPYLSAIIHLNLDEKYHWIKIDWITENEECNISRDMANAEPDCFLSPDGYSMYQSSLLTIPKIPVKP